jgi:hypothetical protein
MKKKVKAVLAALAMSSVAFSATGAAWAAPAAKPAAKARKAPARPAAPAPAPQPLPQVANQVLNWVVSTGDNGDLPFMVIDKVAAVVAVFDASGKQLGQTPALFGITPGDDSSPGVGDRELSDIAPEERTTPAGRFVSKFGPAAGNRRVLWVDYSTSISLHPVVTTNKKERRLDRLKTASADDNRITFGCINVPTRFYTRVVVPNFRKDIGVVYILPETKSLAEAFPAYQAQVVSR